MKVEDCEVHGLPAVRWRSNDGATAVAILQGAHLVSWIPAKGRERIFVSERTAYEAGRAIRGGVPVCFPQFADRGPLAQHGFARTRPWRFTGSREASGLCEAVFVLEDTPETRALWPHAFRVELAIAVGGTRLRMSLTVTNTGGEAFDFTAALHTYFRVADADAAEVDGLRGVRFLTRGAVASETEARETVPAREPVDRIYFAPPATLLLHDGEDVLRLRQEGFTDTVVWNPGREKAAAMADLGEGYRRMLCVEAAAIEPAIALAPGATWRGAQEMDAG